MACSESSPADCSGECLCGSAILQSCGDRDRDGDRLPRSLGCSWVMCRFTTRQSVRLSVLSASPACTLSGMSTNCMSLCVCWLVRVLVRDWKFIFISTRQRFLSSSSHVCVPMDVCFISCPLLNSCINTRRLILKRASVLPSEHS